MRGAVAAALLFPSLALAAPPPTLGEILKPAQHDLVNISPGGDYIAATVRKDGKMLVAIIDRQTMKPERILDPEDKGAVERVNWVSNRRVFVRNSRVGAGVEQAYLEPYIMAVDVDGSRKRVFYASVIDTLLDDDEHVLIERCSKGRIDGCWTYVEKADAESGRGAHRVAEGPMLNASYMADNRGEVRFAYAWDNKGIQRVSLLNEGKWTPLNDESQSGVETSPLGTSRDGTRGYVQTERKQGPDVIEEIVFATGERRVVMSDARLDPEFIVWSADGAQPIGAAYGPGVPRARFWNADDPDARLLKQLEEAFPNDAVAFGSGSRNGQQVVINVWGDRDPGSYYLLDRATRKTSLLLRMKPWLDPDSLAPATPVAFKSRDGFDLTGYLTLPLNVAGTPPLVVLPHGGPFFVRDQWSYDEEVQLLAAHGYAVLRVNFRGSAGFGRQFVESGFRQWGRKMQDDVTDATRWAIAQGKIDPRRICIWGSSYGGYAALMGAIQAPDLYKCTIATAGLTDLNVHWKWGDTHRSKWGRTYLEEAMGKDPKELYELSPVKHAAAIKADVMLVHGIRDPRVSYEHAKAMRAALDAVGKPYEGYFPPDETHGIYGDENREEYYTRVLAFLAANVGGKPAQVAAKKGP